MFLDSKHINKLATLFFQSYLRKFNPSYEWFKDHVGPQHCFFMPCRPTLCTMFYYSYIITGSANCFHTVSTFPWALCEALCYSTLCEISSVFIKLSWFVAHCKMKWDSDPTNLLTHRQVCWPFASPIWLWVQTFAWLPLSARRQTDCDADISSIVFYPWCFSADFLWNVFNTAATESKGKRAFCAIV